MGICNGFQILTESGLLPGTLIRNKELSFICKNTPLKVENDTCFFTNKYKKNEIINIPIATMKGIILLAKRLLKILKIKILLHSDIVIVMERQVI